MGKGTLFLFVALVLLAQTAGAQGSTSTSCSVGPVPCQAVQVALIALSVSLDVVAIGFIISKLFPEAGIGDWLNGEYWEIAKSAMLIVGIFSAITFISNISATLITPPTGTCSGAQPMPSLSYALVNEACGYLSSTQTNIASTFEYLLGISTSLGTLGSVHVGAYLPIPAVIVGFTFGFDLWPYQNNLLESEGDQTESILNGAIEFVAFPVALLIGAQSSLMPFIYALGLVVLLPLGLILRALPFLRGVGGTLVALGIGISLIYPSVLILFNYPVTNALASTVSPPPSPVCNIPWVCSAISAIIGSLGLGGTGTAIASMYSILPALDGITSNITYLLLQFVLFILDLSIVFSLTNGIAQLLGGKIDLEMTETISLK